MKQSEHGLSAGIIVYKQRNLRRARRSILEVVSHIYRELDNRDIARDRVRGSRIMRYSYHAIKKCE
jgi:hypothetical protein